MITTMIRTPPRVGSSQELLLVESDVVFAAGLAVTVGFAVGELDPVAAA